MANYVVDTNVLVMIDKPIAQLTELELACAEACREWLQTFQMNGEDKLVLDYQNRIHQEYRQNIQPQGIARDWLNRVFRAFMNHVAMVNVEYDDNAHAILPETITFDDPSDRKFIAVTLAHTPTPSIINATDTDWDKQKEMLIANGIEVIELCPDYIADKRRSE